MIGPSPTPRCSSGDYLLEFHQTDHSYRDRDVLASTLPIGVKTMHMLQRRVFQGNAVSMFALTAALFFSSCGQRTFFSYFYLNGLHFVHQPMTRACICLSYSIELNIIFLLYKDTHRADVHILKLMQTEQCKIPMKMCSRTICVTSSV